MRGSDGRKRAHLGAHSERWGECPHEPRSSFAFWPPEVDAGVGIGIGIGIDPRFFRFQFR